jgi:hypothetical protein
MLTKVLGYNDGAVLEAGNAACAKGIPMEAVCGHFGEGTFILMRDSLSRVQFLNRTLGIGA